MTTTLTIKGQVTIPKQIRDALDLQPGCKLNFAVNDDGDVLLQKAVAGAKSSKRVAAVAKQKKDRFEQVRGKADVHWRTQDLMDLMRGEH
jgi:AbrB family looped-hinge helix DNA binding protein